MENKKITKDNINSPLREGESWSYKPGQEKDKKKQKSGRLFSAFSALTGKDRNIDATPDWKVAKHLRETNKILEQIQKQLTVDFTNRITERKKEFTERRKALSEAKFFSKEKGLETTKKVGNFVKKTAGNLVSPLAKGFKGIFEGVWKFLTPILTGGVVLGAIEWLSNPENHETIKNTFNWFKDNWKLLAGVGGAALALTAISGGLIAGGGIVAVFGALLLALKAMIVLLPALGALYLVWKNWDTLSGSWYQGGDHPSKATEKNVFGRKRDQMGGVERFFTGLLDAMTRDYWDHDKLGRIYSASWMPWKAGWLPWNEKRASGGTVAPGKSYLVGENGPELLISAGDGMVLDAEKTARLLTPPVTGDSFEIVPLPDKFITSDKTGTITTSNEATRLMKVSSVNLSNRYMVDVPEILGIR